MSTARKQQDFSELWRSKIAGEARPGDTIHALCYVGAAAGPVVTIVTNEPVDISDLLARVSARPQAQE